MMFDQGFAPEIVGQARRRRGRLADLSGRMAENSVTLKYQDGGAELLASRWRGLAGEIDLILREGDCLVFVEVKKSSSHAMAAQRLDRRQMDRICLAALEYVDRHGNGLSEMRFDAALVDDMGRIDVIPNAFGMN